MMSDKQNKQANHDLQFNVAQLLKEVTGGDRRYKINSRALNKLDKNVTFTSSIVGKVRFLRTGTDILVTGSLEGTIEKSCGRCLTPFTQPMSIELEEQFYPTLDIILGKTLTLPNDVEDINRINDQHILDLLEVVRQNFLLESEGFYYCRPDCKGLCPQCGQDRNIDSCTCQDDAIDWRWAGLKALKDTIND